MFDSSKQPPVITIVSIKKQNATVLPEIGMVVTCKVKKFDGGKFNFSSSSLSGFKYQLQNGKSSYLRSRRSDHKGYIPRNNQVYRVIVKEKIFIEHVYLRKEDVRATERDKVEIQKSFRPGDIVRAKVVIRKWVQFHF